MLKLIFVCFLMCFSGLESYAADAAPCDSSPTTLFRIRQEKDQKPVYVLGTLHIQSIDQEPPALREHLSRIAKEEGSRLFNESDPDKNNIDDGYFLEREFLKTADYKQNIRAVLIKEFTDEDDLRALESQYAERRETLMHFFEGAEVYSDFAKIKDFHPLHFYYMTFMQCAGAHFQNENPNLDPDLLMDSFVRGLFDKQRRPMDILESADELYEEGLFQKDILLSRELFEGCVAALDPKLFEESVLKSMKKDITEYALQKKNPRYEAAKDDSFESKWLEWSTVLRNKIWEKKLAPHLDHPTKGPLLICVGMDHLSGESGVFSMLESRMTKAGIEQLMSDNTWRKI